MWGSLKPGKKRRADSYYSTSSYQFEKQNLLLAHAFSGCDTTSTPFGHGKIKRCTLIDSTPALREAATPADISRAGEKILMAMYGTGRTTIRIINELRYHLFVKMSTKAKFILTPTSSNTRCCGPAQLQSIPPGSMVNPLEWGWRRESPRLTSFRSS